MKTVDSYRCSYCGKLYEQKDSCRNHEYKCYFNPATKSCASCAFLRYDSYRYKPGHSFAVRTCMLGHDVAKKLKTKCTDHYPKAELNSAFKVREAEANYRPIPFVKEHLKKLKIKCSGDMTISSNEDVKDWFVDEEYYSVCAEAYINKLAVAIGHKILFYQETELSGTTDLVTDNDLEKHSNFSIDEIDDVISSFCDIGFDKNKIHDIINRVAEKIKMMIVLPGLLITECEIAYNLKMAEALSLLEDEGGAYYFGQMAEKLQKTIRIDKLFEKEYNVSLPKDAFIDLPSKYLTCCKNSISEISPDLKEQITARLGITSISEENKSVNPEYHEVTL